MTRDSVSPRSRSALESVGASWETLVQWGRSGPPIVGRSETSPARAAPRSASGPGEARRSRKADGERTYSARSVGEGRTGMEFLTSNSIRSRNAVKVRQAAPTWRAKSGSLLGPRRMTATTEMTRSFGGSRFSMRASGRPRDRPLPSLRSMPSTTIRINEPIQMAIPKTDCCDGFEPNDPTRKLRCVRGVLSSRLDADASAGLWSDDIRLSPWVRITSRSVSIGHASTIGAPFRGAKGDHNAG